VNINHFTARNIEGGKTLITIGMDIDAALADRLDKAMARLIDVLEVTLTEDGGPDQIEAGSPGAP
jgi:hypothetical protein